MHNLDQERSKGLKQTAVSGFKWTAVAHCVRMTVHFLTTAVLAWLLLPQDFGLVAMAALVVGVVHLFRDFGTAVAVVQRPDLDHDTLSTLFWTNVVAGVVLAGLVALLAPVAAMLFDEPAVMAACTLVMRFLVADHLVPGWHLVVVVFTGVVTYGVASLLWNRRPILEIQDLLLGRARTSA